MIANLEQAAASLKYLQVRAQFRPSLMLIIGIWSHFVRMYVVTNKFKLCNNKGNGRYERRFYRNIVLLWKIAFCDEK